MKKILMSVFAIAAIAAVAGVGSYALWSDTESFDGNSIQAGYMDLMVASEPIAVGPVVPGQTGRNTMTITNDGDVDGTLSVVATDFVDYENYCVEPEKIDGADPSCTLNDAAAKAIDGTPAHPFVGAGNGELSQFITVQFDINGAPVGSAMPLSTLISTPTPIAIPTAIPAGQSVTVGVTWTVSDSTTPFADNIFMTDAVVGNFDLLLTQDAPGSL